MATKTIPSIAILASLFLVIGCGERQINAVKGPPNNQPIDTSSEQSLPTDQFPSETDTNDIKINGWTIHYPKTLKGMQITMIDGVLGLTFDDFRFEVRDNEIYVDDVNYGTASKNDKVLIGFAGKISVNGEIRNPVTEN